MTKQEIMIKYGLTGPIIEPAPYYYERVIIAMQEYADQIEINDADSLGAAYKRIDEIESAITGYVHSCEEEEQTLSSTFSRK